MTLVFLCSFSWLFCGKSIHPAVSLISWVSMSLFVRSPYIIWEATSWVVHHCHFHSPRDTQSSPQRHRNQLQHRTGNPSLQHCWVTSKLLQVSWQWWSFVRGSTSPACWWSDKISWIMHFKTFSTKSKDMLPSCHNNVIFLLSSWKHVIFQDHKWPCRSEVILWWHPLTQLRELWSNYLI